ncbi:peptidoglycan-binding protein LysM [Desulfuromonas soudanensis]|uniref:Peptidoglycan-binding protein LysM n=1 Tax=Desulfuromonas soudanensis TaxID=1603606 RepID=A0A0M3QF33_9BACT|nr:LysM domain-containing protein [Desulfuromonas soudanensis]ALC15519.1 peptidoglycan-binding protein LysM [Desulfuromonas soudanensis]
MTVRKALILICLLILPLSAWAKGETKTYVIKKGDTLWGISQKFITDPYYWPNLWANNPFITNPHLIYPGQTVAIRDGRIEIVPVLPETDGGEIPAQEIVETPPAMEEWRQELPEPVESITIKTAGGGQGFVTLEELDALGTIVDTVDNRILMGEGETVFVDMKELSATRPGDKFSLVEIGKEIRHPLTDKLIGYQIADLGSLKITEVHPRIATAVIDYTFREVHRGALLLPYQAPLMEIVLKRADRSLDGVVISSGDGKIALGQHDIIHLDLGALDGLQAGNMLYVSRQRQASDLGLQGDQLQLPDMLLGSAVVLETRAHTASALLLKSADAIYRGDKVTTVTE